MAAAIVLGPWNRTAYATAQSFAEGSVQGTVTLVGPEGSGKALLLDMAAELIGKSGLPFTHAKIAPGGWPKIEMSPQGTRKSSYLLLGDVDAGSARVQQTLVQLIDLARDSGASVLMTCSDTSKLVPPLRRRVSEGLCIPVSLPPTAA